MLDDAGLEKVLQTLTPISLGGHGYRSIAYEALIGNPPYPQPRPLYSLGAPKTGGRYTPKGGPATLYVATDPVTALAESWQSDLARIGEKLRAPAVSLAIEYELECVLDLTDMQVQQAIQTTEAELKASWRQLQARGKLSPTQALGQYAFLLGRYQALHVPSAKTNGTCLVIFPDRLKAPSFVRVFDPSGQLAECLPTD